ncbi:hypothetical protein BGZ63DRAFT_385292 [Mariannaea sp. PMI_226]|nr:hypothetical protein BGZ63DRAFT_385292 [Mariannaea sp. PMI_226]
MPQSAPNILLLLVDYHPFALLRPNLKQLFRTHCAIAHSTSSSTPMLVSQST